MFLFHPTHFLKFLVKSQPQRSYKKGSYRKKKVYCTSHLTSENATNSCLFELYTAGLIASDMWLSLITKMSSEDQQNLTILAIYAGLVTAGFVLAIVRTFLFYYLCLRSSGSLHDRVADRLLHTPVLFFDTNPAGRILNRLSKDVGLVDEMLPKALLATIQYLLVMLSGLLVPSITSFWIIFALVPVIVIFVLLSWYYLKSSRELQRLESIYRSPVFSHFSETMSGLDTIRTRRMEKEFINRFYRYTGAKDQLKSKGVTTGSLKNGWHPGTQGLGGG